MQNIPIPRITFLQWVKYPWAALLICAVFGLGVMFNINSNINNQRIIDCNRNNVELKKELSVKDEQLNQLTTALLIKNGIINEINSIVKEKVGDDAKRIISK